MIFDELFQSMLPERVQKKLPDLQFEDISELYDAWYKLQFEKYHLDETIKTRSDISFNVLEKVVSEVSKALPPADLTQAIARADVTTKVDALKDKFMQNRSDRSGQIQSDIKSILSKIQDYCISVIQNKDFKIDLTMTLYEDLAQGKLELDIPSELRVPIFFMFNDVPPNLNLADERIYRSLYKFVPNNVKEEFRKLKPKYEDEKKAQENSQPATPKMYYNKKLKKYMPSKFASQENPSVNVKYRNESLRNMYANQIKKYLSKVIGIELPDSEKFRMSGSEYSDKFTIPVGIRHVPTDDRYDPTKFDTNVTYLEIFLYSKGKGILFTDGCFMNKTDVDQSSWKYEKPRIITSGIFGLKTEASNIDAKILADAASKIIATFAINNIAYKLQYKEVILPIKNPNRND